MKQPFYRAFEDRHRGSRELIKSRLQVYLQFIEPLKKLYPEVKALDLGCGRGEWLELLGEQGFIPHGVDIDSGMLAACKKLGLSAEKKDAIVHLKSLPAASLEIVSGFHLAEHLPFSELQELVSEALRVLRPCGLLILETPNPENIVVGTTNFYLDPTHQRPIPPQLLSFLPDYYGFQRSKILRLQESPQLQHSSRIHLLDVLAGPSPDYAVVAQKEGGKAEMAAFDVPFDAEYGLTMDALAQRHEESLGKTITSIGQRVDFTEKVVRTLGAHDSRIESLTAQNTELQVALARADVQVQGHALKNDELASGLAQQEKHSQWLQSEWDAAKAQLCEVRDQLSSANGKIDELNHSSHHWYTAAQELTVKVDELNQSSHHWFITAQNLELQRSIEKSIFSAEQKALQAKAEELGNTCHNLHLTAQNLEQRLRAVYASSSWRLTAPLRFAMLAIIAIFSPRTYIDPVKRVLRTVILHANLWFYARPYLRVRALKLISRFPYLEMRLRSITGVAPQPPSGQPATPDPGAAPATWQQMPAQAKTICHDLEAKMAEQGKKI